MGEEAREMNIGMEEKEKEEMNQKISEVAEKDFKEGLANDAVHHLKEFREKATKDIEKVIEEVRKKDEGHAADDAKAVIQSLANVVMAAQVNETSKLFLTGDHIIIPGEVEYTEQRIHALAQNITRDFEGRGT